MKIVTAWPPNIDAIDAVFGVRAREGGVIFTYGDTVYNPDGRALHPALVAHEGVHVRRQTSPAQWWDRYLVDAEFRLREELPAHQAEYRALCGATRDREACSRYLSIVARKLAAPLYGSIITAAAARKVIRG